MNWIDKLIRDMGCEKATMNDKVDKDAEAKAFYGVRYSLGVGIINVIKNAGDLDKLDSARLRMILDAIRGSVEYADAKLYQLERLEHIAWKEARHDNRSKD